MMTRILIFGLLTVLLANLELGTAQGPRLRRNATLHPCPGGTASVDVHPLSVPGTLDQLVYMSKLIVVGTVADVLPAINVNPDNLRAIETHSQIAVEERLYGTMPRLINTILLVQMGGKAGPCELTVPADPLVQRGEQYVFFLYADNRTEIPVTSGLPRYLALGLWAGKAKVVNGKIEFLPSAGPRLHEYDNMDARVFIAAVEERIKVLRRLN